MRHFIFAAAFFGLASPAASSVVTIDLTLRLTAQDWYFYDVRDYATDRRLSTFVKPEADETVYGMSPPLGQRRLADIISLRATIDPDVDTSISYGEARDCFLGSYRCKTGSYGSARINSDNDLYIGNDGGSSFEIVGSMNVGERIDFNWDSGYRGYCEYVVNDVIQWYASTCAHKSTFAVVRDNLAPVPVPTSLPMLATGLIGAGWWVRRRKRMVAP